ncbi:bifunctional 3,4-dihydroxy-2-butanone-4-phosphate synthase/GTP cyclohydrolase II [Lacicoccus alkaliphilus]|uniref:3,4-dihydroxy-2-butanone 4-phosphate synthase n=1 Tax=Lacicoccus alkaliphilus DSM 16010 TaxID=1123231 RepID=A0A1M7F7Q7_9BACL|nr:bifunctional 3,4-dihydroxy-2-butanone-4-phosphate synthase/GTP cyclohydrolase II [Salinicoccus alkaliphilus]SHL99788.1 3,4-dihydroxy 2-butanone 4-phosphate synthase / GTP cyclohydrolase II [Salinicoccus alkaliphilus DSM 16010]
MFDSIKSALEDLKRGGLVIVVDDEDRENEGDLVGIAEYMGPEAINFMATHGRGLICAPITKAIAEKLELAPMAENNSDPHGTAFTVSIDHTSTTTGISAFERFDTIQALIDDDTRAADFNTPGHIFPLVAKDGGVLERMGHTEAAVDLSRLAGAKAAGVICEIMNDDGTMARVDDLKTYKEKHGLKMITIEDLKAYISSYHRMMLDSTVNMPTKYGRYKMFGFKDRVTGEEHIALLHGKVHPNMNVRIHSECLTGDVFHSERCDCGEQLDLAMKITSEEDGVILYMRQEGRGIGLLNKLKAYELIEQGYDTVTANAHLGFDADLRTYEAAAGMLKALGLHHVTLLSNNPAKVSGLENEGIQVTRRSHIIEANVNNADYLNIKEKKLGHQL